MATSICICCICCIQYQIQVPGTLLQAATEYCTVLQYDTGPTQNFTGGGQTRYVIKSSTIIILLVERSKEYRCWRCVKAAVTKIGKVQCRSERLCVLLVVPNYISLWRTPILREGNILLGNALELPVLLNTAVQLWSRHKIAKAHLTIARQRTRWQHSTHGHIPHSWCILYLYSSILLWTISMAHFLVMDYSGTSELPKSHSCYY